MEKAGSYGAARGILRAYNPILVVYLILPLPHSLFHVVAFLAHHLPVVKRDLIDT